MTATSPATDHAPDGRLGHESGDAADQFSLDEEAVRAQLAGMPPAMIKSVLFLLLERMLPANDEAEGLQPILWRGFLPNGLMLTVGRAHRPR